jgi:anaerobic magnesium-protoporphyrin IX monomethyl ester cyclase
MGDFRVAFVNPRDPNIPSGNYAVYENLGIGLVTAYLRQNGYQVHIADAFAEDVQHDAIIDRVADFKPDLVGFACNFQTYDGVDEIAAALRARLPRAHFSIGSEHATYAAEDILRSSRFIDSVVRGEGEETMLDLVQAVESSRPLDTVEGIHFRAGDKVIANPERASTRDLDTLPFAARDTLAQAAATGKPILIGMLASRGCYSKCTFCNAHHFFRLGGGKAVRRRSAQNIADEIQELNETYVRDMMQRGIDVTLYFYDATFIPPDPVSQAWGREIAEELIRRGIRIPFKAFMRADSFTEKDAELIELLKRAGLRSVFIGFESGSNEVLEAYAKGASVEQNLKTVQMLKRYGLYGVTNGFIMFGPYSTLPNLRSNVDFLLASDQASYYNMSQRMQVFPGLKLEEGLREDGLLLPRPSFNSVYHYRYLDARAGALAEKADFNDHPTIQRENSFVRYVRNTKTKIEGLLAQRGIEDAGLQRLGEAVDRQWRVIGQMNARTFHRFIDLAENGWSEDEFQARKSQFLDDLDTELDRLEGCFETYLEYLHEELPKRGRPEMPGISQHHAA